MLNYKVKKKEINTHGWVIRNQISNVFTKQTHYTFCVYVSKMVW